MEWLKGIFNKNKDPKICSYKFISRKYYHGVEIFPVDIIWPGGSVKSISISRSSPGNVASMIGFGDLVTVALSMAMINNTGLDGKPLSVFRLNKSKQYYVVYSNVMDKMYAERG